jgi:hypothetical protein
MGDERIGEAIRIGAEAGRIHVDPGSEALVRPHAGLITGAADGRRAKQRERTSCGEGRGGTTSGQHEQTLIPVRTGDNPAGTPSTRLSRRPRHRLDLLGPQDGRPEALLDLVELPELEEHVADDQQGPPLPDDLERGLTVAPLVA